MVFVFFFASHEALALHFACLVLILVLSGPDKPAKKYTFLSQAKVIYLFIFMFTPCPDLLGGTDFENKFGVLRPPRSCTSISIRGWGDLPSVTQPRYGWLMVGWSVFSPFSPAVANMLVHFDREMAARHVPSHWIWDMGVRG